MASSDGPIEVGTVTLAVNELNPLRDFYRDVIGLQEQSGSRTQCELGVGHKTLLRLIEDRAAVSAPEQPGLFHTAFVLPDRQSLGSWLNHAAGMQVSLDGAADHLVSEAVYLTDPEGNGIEMYVDRDRSLWHYDNGRIRLDTLPLDMAELQQTASHVVWQAVPEGSAIGHVHLQVGEVGVADEFYCDQLGFERTAFMGSASFYGSGGYHHQLAGNIWNSRGSKRQPVGARGLRELELLVADSTRAGSQALDPFGIQIKLTAQELSAAA